MELATAERNWLGFTHAEVGANLAKQWCFPDIISGTIAHQHDVDRAYDEMGEREGQYTAIAALSSEIAIRHVRRQPAFEQEELAAHPLSAKLNLSSIQLESIQSRFEEAFEDMNRVFHI